MTDKPPRKGDPLPPKPHSSDVHERPTIPPPFDVEAFARRQMPPSAAPPEGDAWAAETRTEPMTVSYEVNFEPGPLEATVLGGIEGATGPEITERTIDDPMAEMSQCFSVQDYVGALEIAELILADDPRNQAAVGCRENCRVRLENMYASHLRPDRVPMVLMPPEQADSLTMERSAGLMLSLVDGTSTVEKILDQSGLPKLDALRILDELVSLKIVGFA